MGVEEQPHRPSKSRRISPGSGASESSGTVNTPAQRPNGRGPGRRAGTGRSSATWRPPRITTKCSPASTRSSRASGFRWSSCKLTVVIFGIIARLTGAPRPRSWRFCPAPGPWTGWGRAVRSELAPFTCPARTIRPGVYGSTSPGSARTAPVCACPGPKSRRFAPMRGQPAPRGGRLARMRGQTAPAVEPSAPWGRPTDARGRLGPASRGIRQARPVPRPGLPAAPGHRRPGDQPAPGQRENRSPPGQRGLASHEVPEGWGCVGTSRDLWQGAC